METTKDTAESQSRATALPEAEFQALCQRIVAAENRRKRLMIGRSEQEPIFELSAKIEIEHRTSATGGVFD